MSPCKECLIRAGCSEDCKEFKNYSKFASELMTLIAIVLSGAILVGGLFFIGLLANEPTNTAKAIGTVIWIVSAIGGIMMNTFTEEKLGDFVILIFAPYVFLVFINLYLLAYIFKINVRKRA